MGRCLTLYHGSDQVVKHPAFGAGRPYNDFGLGFYCTEHQDLAQEWAVSSLRGGCVNRYTLDTEHLNIVYLNGPDGSILHWLAVLLEHRLFPIRAPIAHLAKRYLVDQFGVDTSQADVIVGHRADDSYFSYAKSFLHNTISLEQLAWAVQRDRQGEQIVVRSQQAFSQLRWEGAEPVEQTLYYARRKVRDVEAREHFRARMEHSDWLHERYVQDLVRGKLKNNGAV